MQAFEQLLNLAAGLDPGPLRQVIAGAVRSRLRATQSAGHRSYFDLLLCSEQELEELLELVLVNESWFFRDSKPMLALAHRWLEHRPDPGRPVRLLSLPCASGEEPYSLAMALLDVNHLPHSFEIDAVDISASALRRARAGVYGPHSFRSRDLSFRERHFQATPEGFRINPATRARVRFIKANLLHDPLPVMPRTYDVVFCRNLLIYLDEDARRKALGRLTGLLTPTGQLVVGLAEQDLLLNSGLVRGWLPHSFGLPDPMSSARKTLGTHPPARAERLAPTSPGRPRSTAVFPGLRRARELADAGRLAEAGAFCEAHVAEHKTCAEGWCLLGIIREVQGLPQFAECYRRALYLDPNHRETLWHLSALARRQGDSVEARLLLNRALRQEPAPAET